MSQLTQQIQALNQSHGMWTGGNRILVGLSGGADSVALLRALHDIAPQEKLALACAHVNYGLRADSNDDQAFCQKLCRDLDIPMYVLERPTKPDSANVQLWARRVRYEWFGDLCDEHECTSMAVGHTLNDRAETFILQLFRGAGRGAVANMQPRTGNVIRPLLYTRRSEVESYLKKMKQAFRTDSTNAQPAYRRNRVRHELLPLLSDIFSKDAEHNLVAAADLYELEDQYLQQQAAHLLDSVEECTGYRRIDLNVLKQAHPALQLQLFKALVVKLGGSPGQGRLLDLVHLVHRAPGKRAQLSGGYTAERGRDHIWIFEASALPRSVPLELTGDTQLPDGHVLHVHPADPEPPFPDGRCRVRVSIPHHVNRLHLRLAKEGDRIQPFGMSGTRLVYDMLAEAGVPRFLRERTWLLSDDQTIYWLPGIRPAEAVRVHPGDKRVYELAWDAAE